MDNASNRQPRGIPSGGQFAARDRGDAEITLSDGPAVHTRASDVVYFAPQTDGDIHADFTGRHVAKLTAEQLHSRKLILHGGTVRITGPASIEARGDAVVEALGGATIVAHDRAIVRGIGADITADGDTRIDAGFGSKVDADGRAHVEARDTTTVTARGDATIVHDSDGHITTSENATATTRHRDGAPAR